MRDWYRGPWSLNQSRTSASTRMLIGRLIGEQFDDDLNQVPLNRYFQLDAHISHPLGEQGWLFLAVENLTNTEILVNRSPVDFLGTPFQIRGGIYFRLFHR